MSWRRLTTRTGDTRSLLEVRRTASDAKVMLQRADSGNFHLTCNPPEQDLRSVKGSHFKEHLLKAGLTARSRHPIIRHLARLGPL